MKNRTEIELKFIVPQAARAGIVTELERGSATLDRTSLMAMYLDTDDRRLARAGMSWRLDDLPAIFCWTRLNCRPRLDPSPGLAIALINGSHTASVRPRVAPDT